MTMGVQPVKMIAREDLNASIRDIPLPDRMLCLPVSSKGYPVPYFVTKKNDDGEWDFRVIQPERMLKCMTKSLCWLCGKPLGQFKVFVTGPMCVTTRTTAEPPCHLDCARYAALACPFLSQPKMRRNEKNLPLEDDRITPGIMIKRNPGVSGVYVTKSWKPFRDGKGGVLIQMGLPERVEWYAERRLATKAEVIESIATGVPLLVQASPPSEHPEIMRNVAAMRRLLPAE